MIKNLSIPLIHILLILIFSQGCSGPKIIEKEVGAGYSVLGLNHPELSYVWLFPDEFTGESRLELPGWVFHSDAVPFEGSAWIKPLDGTLASKVVLERDDLQREMDKQANKIILNAEFLAGGNRGAFNISVIESRSGRDRMGTPVEIRIFDLTLDSNDEQRPAFIADWVARQMGGAAILSNRHTNAGVFKIAIAMVQLINAFGEPQLTANGIPNAAYAVWVAVPGRLNDPNDFVRLAVEFADVFPIATKFSNIALTTETLTLPKQTKSIAIIATFDHQSLLEIERPQVLSDFLAALETARQTGVELKVAIARSCEPENVKSPGASDFVSNKSSDAFVEELSSRFNQMFEDESLDCLANMAQRTSILVARESNEDWSGADERWFFWLTKRPDIANVSLDNVLLSVNTNEYQFALAAEKASYYAIGAADQTCNDVNKTTVPQQPDVASEFKSKINSLSGTWIEYCEQWQVNLGELWASRASFNSNLTLGLTPLPGSLAIFSRGASVPTGGDFGFEEDRGTGAIIPGASIEFGTEDVWTATYTTIIEPDVTEL